MRLAAVPILGEVITRPSRMGTRMLWQLAFHDPSFLTRDFVETRYALAAEPGAQQAVLRTLRGFVSFGGFRRGQIAALRAAMQSMKQPTLIIWGRQDRLVPADHARILEGKLQRASTILFDNCGHFPQVERPLRFNTAVLDFLGNAQEPQ
jgi:pimeloyl-ACP methyl ester carboxylesterase